MGKSIFTVELGFDAHEKCLKDGFFRLTMQEGPLKGHTLHALPEKCMLVAPRTWVHVCVDMGLPQ